MKKIEIVRLDLKSLDCFSLSVSHAACRSSKKLLYINFNNTESNVQESFINEENKVT